MSQKFPISSNYRQPDPAKIIETIDLLQRRAQERFPEAGLNRLIAELREIASESVARTE